MPIGNLIEGSWKTDSIDYVGIKWSWVWPKTNRLMRFLPVMGRMNRVVTSYLVKPESSIIFVANFDFSFITLISIWITRSFLIILSRSYTRSILSPCLQDIHILIYRKLCICKSGQILSLFSGKKMLLRHIYHLCSLYKRWEKRPFSDKRGSYYPN